MLMLKAFPPSSGLSKTYSPRNIMTGKPLDYEKHCRLPFGAYAQTHEDKHITNGMITRTEGGICLGPTGNLEGNYSFLSLRTGRMVTRGHFYKVPTPGVVTRRVLAMAIAEGQHDGLIFEDHHGATLDEGLGDDNDNATNDVADAAGVEVDVDYNANVAEMHDGAAAANVNGYENDANPYAPLADIDENDNADDNEGN